MSGSVIRHGFTLRFEVIISNKAKTILTQGVTSKEYMDELKILKETRNDETVTFEDYLANEN